MRFRDLFLTVRRSFIGNRSRWLLTLSGIVIGSASIVMLAGLVQGGEQALLKANQDAQGTDLLKIHREEASAKDLLKPSKPLSRYDAQALDDLPGLEGANVISETHRGGRAIWQGRQKRIRLVGGTPRTQALMKLNLARGRFIDDDDVTARRRVCVIGDEIWEDLFHHEQDLSQLQLKVSGNTWQVVGVLEHKPSMDKGDGTWRWDRRVLVPHTTFDVMFDPSHKVDSLIIQAPDPRTGAQPISALTQVVDSVLLRRHFGIRNFKIEGDKNGTSQEKLILWTIKALLLGTGLLSMFVGGINIMNIMLVTVTERTREIGVRRAVGASPRHILTQFLTEASVVSVAGGLIGIVSGVAVSWMTAWGLRHALGHWPFILESWSMVLSLTLALVTGIAFGLMPAWKAARLQPVEALRQGT